MNHEHSEVPLVGDGDAPLSPIPFAHNQLVLSELGAKSRGHLGEIRAT